MNGLFRLLLSLILFISLNAFAHGRTDLWQTYCDAAHNDPVFKEQLATYLESEQATPEARAALLPVLDFRGELSRTWETTRLAGSNDFNSNQYSINVSQPIVDIASFLQLSQAKASVRAAAALISAQEQDLIVRSVQAYLNVLRTKALLHYTREQVDFARHFYWITKERFKLKYATITDIDQAKQQYELLRAQYLTAKINDYNSIQELSLLTATQCKYFGSFKKSFPLLTPKPNKIGIWLHLADAHNLFLQASRLDMIAAKKQVTALSGNFLPTIKAFGSYLDQNELSTLVRGAVPEKVTQGVAGAEISWNLIQGGLTIAQIKQAAASYQRSIASMQKHYLTTIADTRKAYFGILKGVPQVRYAHLAMKAGYDGIKHVEEGFRAGVQTIFDLLQAQNRLFAAQRQYVTDFYAYVFNTILLKQAAGTLCPEDVHQLNRWISH